MMNARDIKAELMSLSYHGRGIMIGMSEDAQNAVCIYFIMGRSENSRNRVFVQEGNDMRTKAFDDSKLSDPSLIIYYPKRALGNDTIITNGDQTDTVLEHMKSGDTFENALRSRRFEPDKPNFTPRISGYISLDGGLSYKLSILKSQDDGGNSCQRFFYEYESAMPGTVRFIHTYMGDGNPLASFEGEPKLLSINGDIDKVTRDIWEALNDDNKISLFVEFTDIESGVRQTRIVNKHCKG